MEDLVKTTIRGQADAYGVIRKTFHKKRVFVTGHTGFKGSWLSIMLDSVGAHITGYSLSPPTSPSNFIVSGVRALVSSHYEADIRDKGTLDEAIRSCQPDFIFHFAAQPLVHTSYISPLETWDINVHGTAILLEAIRSIGRPVTAIIVTSDKCYEMIGSSGARKEEDRIGGHDPYSASKGACELLVDSYRRSFFNVSNVYEHGIRVSTVRAGNVIGGGDWAPYRLIPDIVKHLSKGESVPIRHPDAVRPWQHVLEPISGYLMLASLMHSRTDGNLCSSWNFGPFEQDTSRVSEVVGAFCEEWGAKSGWYRVESDSRRYETPTLRLSIDKAIKNLGWSPRWELKQALQKTARWYWAFYRANLPSMLEVTRADIHDFYSDT